MRSLYVVNKLNWKPHSVARMGYRLAVHRTEQLKVDLSKYRAAAGKVVATAHPCSAGGPLSECDPPTDLETLLACLQRYCHPER